MAVTGTDIVNQALMLMGDNQPPVTGNSPTFDDSPAGVAASYLYDDTVQAVARQLGWDFSRNVAPLVSTGQTPPLGYADEFLYPTMGVQVRQLVPATIPDINDPLPTNWTVGNTLVNCVQAKVIWSKTTPAKAVFTNQPWPALWDALFRQAVVRLLAEALAMALAGRLDTAQKMIDSAGKFATTGVAQQG